MRHPFRTDDPQDPARTPMLAGWRGRLYVVAGTRLRLWVPAFLSRIQLHMAISILGLVVQLVLLWLLGQMVDLCISLFEVWAELAAKHLEITLDTTS